MAYSKFDLAFTVIGDIHAIITFSITSHLMFIMLSIQVTFSNV